MDTWFHLTTLDELNGLVGKTVSRQRTKQGHRRSETDGVSLGGKGRNMNLIWNLRRHHGLGIKAKVI